jgi:hypothetical protein
MNSEARQRKGDGRASVAVVAHTTWQKTVFHVCRCQITLRRGKTEEVRPGLATCRYRASLSGEHIPFPTEAQCLSINRMSTVQPAADAGGLFASHDLSPRLALMPRLDSHVGGLQTLLISVQSVTFIR